MDWPALIASIQETGMTQKQIAEHCAVAQSTVSDLKNGGIESPSFDFGTKLVDLLASRTRRAPGKRQQARVPAARLTA